MPEDKSSELEKVKTELEGVDVAIEELERELQQLKKRREDLVKRESKLRSEVQGTSDAASSNGKDNMTSLPLGALKATSTGSPSPQSSEPMVFGMDDDNESPREAGVSPAGHGDEWEQSLESFGVARCGVCGMKLPMDTEAIEQHSLECEAAMKKGKKLEVRPSTTIATGYAPITDRAASLRSNLARKASGVGR
eukprot:TRINITY_DN50009_c0_g1_i1.p1 TRINITY_DN50009_c0_g1~~TRINITY_DN50009_c0_g1_i1.p1  ORF type:complete len:194 (-),score=56.50 TRINITY_DN50009_c0_g1_i1:173-754(-)